MKEYKYGDGAPLRTGFQCLIERKKVEVQNMTKDDALLLFREATREMEQIIEDRLKLTGQVQEKGRELDKVYALRHALVWRMERKKAVQRHIMGIVERD